MHGTSDTRYCPHCGEMIKAEVVKCRYCGSRFSVPAAPGSSPLRDEWFRLQHGKMLGGVCAGLANHFNISVSLLRLAFVVASIIPTFGVGVLIYIVCG